MKIKESIYIRAFDDGNLMNSDKGTSINTCWNEFNDVVRRSVKKNEALVTLTYTFPQVELLLEAMQFHFLYFHFSVWFRSEALPFET